MAQTPALHGGQPAPPAPPRMGACGESSPAGSFLDTGPGLIVWVKEGGRTVIPGGCPAGVLGEPMAGVRLPLLEGSGAQGQVPGGREGAGVACVPGMTWSVWRPEPALLGRHA